MHPTNNTEYPFGSPPYQVRVMSLRARRFAIGIVLFSVLGLSANAQDFVEGFTEPYLTVDVSVGEPGVVRRVEVKPGESVHSGQILVELDSTVLSATLAIAKEKAEGSGSVEAAEAEMRLRQERLMQISQLRQRGHATQREYTRAETDATISLARLKLAREEKRLNKLDCERIQAQIAQRQVSSPFDGVVAEVHREVGESLPLADPRIVTLVQLDKLRTRFSASPEVAASLKPNQKVQVTLTQSDKKIDAVVERISPVIDAKSGTLEVHVVIDNKKQKLRSGTRCLLEVESSNEQPSKKTETLTVAR